MSGEVPPRDRRAAAVITLSLYGCLSSPESSTNVKFLHNMVRKYIPRMPRNTNRIASQLVWLIQDCDSLAVHDAYLSSGPLNSSPSPHHKMEHEEALLAHRRRITAMKRTWRSRVVVSMDQPGYLQDLCDSREVMLAISSVSANLQYDKLDVATSTFRKALAMTQTIARTDHPANRRKRRMLREEATARNMAQTMQNMKERGLGGVQMAVLRTMANERVRFHNEREDN